VVAQNDGTKLYGLPKPKRNPILTDIRLETDHDPVEGIQETKKIQNRSVVASLPMIAEPWPC
ncbi:MAG: hypothetical protein PVJ53_18020, partial [Desulfobacterales bacterium]